MSILQSGTLPLEILVHTLINQYLLSSYCVIVITEELDLKLPSNFIYLRPNNITTDSFTNILLRSSELGCSDYIVQINNPKDFIFTYDKVVHLGNIRRSDRKIIILPSLTLPVNESRRNLIGILSLHETAFIANILIILPIIKTTECDFYDLVSHKYVGRFDNDQLQLLDTWNICTNVFEKNVNLFPHNMSNMYEKEVKVAAFTYKPYVLLDLDTTIESNARDGMEIRIVDEFCRWINCTVKIVRDDEHQWGQIYENLTGVGVLGNVVEGRADLGITALYLWYEEYLVMDFSDPVIRTAITCIAPSPRLLDSWEMPLLPFSLYMWVCILCTFLYESFALYVSQGFSSHKVFLTTFGIMITQSQSNAGFTSWRIRSVVGWMMLTGLILDNAYGGGLASTFTVPKYEKSIDSIQDIVNRKMEWGATHDAWIFSIILSQEPLIKQLVNLFRTYPAEELKRRSYTRSMAYGIEKLPAGYFAIGEYITKEASLDFTTMLENFYYEQCVVMMRKSSPYTDKLNEFIGRLHQSGLILAWETQVALKYLDYEVQIEVKLSRSKRDVENIEPLSFRQVVGIFIIYGIGVACASILFIAEILLHKHG